MESIYQREKWRAISDEHLAYTEEQIKQKLNSSTGQADSPTPTSIIDVINKQLVNWQTE
jgi:hypothetical protein